MKNKSLVCIALIFLGFLQYRLWSGSGGIISTTRLYSQLEAKRQANQTLLAYNLDLADQIKSWKAKNSSVVEAYARHDLGMLKNHEIFYRVIRSGDL